MKTTLTAIGLAIMSYGPALADVRCEFGTDHPCPVPEPGTVALLGGALVMLAVVPWACRQISRLLPRRAIR